jgi:hypothetical protein
MRNDKLFFNIGNNLNKLFRGYCGNRTGGKILSVSGNYIINSKTFSNNILNGVLKIAPFQIKRLINIIARYSSRIKNMQQMFYSFSRGFFTQFFTGDIEDVSYRRSGNISGETLLFGKFKDYSCIGGKSGIIKYNVQSDISIKRGTFALRARLRSNQNFHYKCLASLSSRISSMLMSPNLERILRSASVWGVRLLSAFLLIIPISPASDLCTGSLPAETGKKRILACPAGTSGGTSMVNLWFTGISTVCVILIRKI